jgi:hypothetical protein
MPDEPKSMLEREPIARGPKLAMLIFLLWLPLAILVAGISAMVEVNVILLVAFFIGTTLSAGIAFAALRMS